MASTVTSSNPLAPVFTASGLASGLDTNSLIDGLTQIAAQPITALQTQESGIKAQVSIVGDLAARLSSLKDAVDGLSSSGALGVQTTSTNTAFTATTSSGSTAGRYQVSVDQLATAAQARSQAFASNTAPVKGGTLTLNVQGTAYNLTVTDGEALSDVALAIQQLGAPITATVLNDGTHSYLSLTDRATGFPINGTASQALSITENSTGTTGQALGLAITTPAQNAKFTIDGLQFTRTSNTVTDAIPGTTLTLNSQSANGPETLLTDYDTSATQANLQKFVDAYNHVMQLVQSQLDITDTTDTTQTLAHDPAIRSLQQSMSDLIISKVGNGPISTLADLGIETGEDGSLSIDSSKLANAMSTDPSAVNSIFQDATSGLGKLTDSLVQQYTDPVNGVLTFDTQGMNNQISQMDDQISSLQLRVNAYHDMLAQQFTDMESMVAKMKAVGSYLTQQQSASQSK